MTREQRLILFKLLPERAQYVEVLARDQDSLLLAWRARQWGTTAGMVRVQAIGPLAALDRGDRGTRLENKEIFHEIRMEEVSL